VRQQASAHGPTWDEIISDVRSGVGSAERHDVGQWALEQIRDALGEEWPRRWHARHGGLPAFLERASTDALAYAQLIETGLRLSSLAGTLRLRRVTREWSRHLEGIRWAWRFAELPERCLLRFAVQRAKIGVRGDDALSGFAVMTGTDQSGAEVLWFRKRGPRAAEIVASPDCSSPPRPSY
jgi:hypothetical protein